MTNRITFAIPFEGFYQTELGEALDDHILRLNGVSPGDYIDSEAYLETVDYSATHNKIAEQYAIEWLKHRDLKTGKFEEYIPPRTVQPRSFLNVSVELRELTLAYAAIQAEYGRSSTLEAWADLPLEYAWEEAWECLEVREDHSVKHSIREALLRNGHMDPVFK